MAYLLPYVCFNCQKSFKRAENHSKPVKCPDCRGETFRLSRKFKPPPRGDEKQWEKVEYLVRRGFTFDWVAKIDGDHSMLYRPPPPKTLKEAIEFAKTFRPRHLLAPHEIARSKAKKIAKNENEKKMRRRKKELEYKKRRSK